MNNIEWKNIQHNEEECFFRDHNQQIQKEYSSLVSIEDLFLNNGAGTQTKRDNIFVDFEKDTLEKRIKKMLLNELTAEEQRIRHLTGC